MRSLFFGFCLAITGCEGIKLTGSMCESIGSHHAMHECRAYDEEAALKASMPSKKLDCLKCQEPEKIEIRR